MRKTIRYASILTVTALLVSPALAADEPEVPNINKRGDNEKAFAEKLAKSIVTNARTSVKSDTVKLNKYEKKEPKTGRTELHINAGFKGAITKKDYTARIVVLVDSSDKDKWEVLRIDYKDDVKGLTAGKPNLKKISALREKMNAKPGK
jgi:hypothetical protein